MTALDRRAIITSLAAVAVAGVVSALPRRPILLHRRLAPILPAMTNAEFRPSVAMKRFQGVLSVHLPTSRMYSSSPPAFFNIPVSLSINESKWINNLFLWK